MFKFYGLLRITLKYFSFWIREKMFSNPFCLKFAWKRPSKFWVKASIVQPFHKFVVHSTFLLHFTLLRCTYILLWFSNDAYSSFKSCGNFFYYCGGIWLDSCKSLLPNYALSWRWFSVGICKYKPGYKSYDLLYIRVLSLVENLSVNKKKILYKICSPVWML